MNSILWPLTYLLTAFFPVTANQLLSWSSFCQQPIYRNTLFLPRMFLPNCISSSPFLILLHLYFRSILLCPNFTLSSRFPSCCENSEELMVQRDEEISTTLSLSILNRYMRSHVCEMCKYMATQEFRCTSGHRFSRIRVRENFPELHMIFTVEWSFLCSG